MQGEPRRLANLYQKSAKHERKLSHIESWIWESMFVMFHSKNFPAKRDVDVLDS